MTACDRDTYTKIFSVFGRFGLVGLVFILVFHHAGQLIEANMLNAMHQLYRQVKSQRCLFESIAAGGTWLPGLALIICFQSTFEQATES